MGRSALLFFFLTASIGLVGLSDPLLAQERPDALVMYRNGQYDQAVQTCLSELQQMPKNMDSYSVLGWSLLKLGRYQDAVNYGTKALAVSRYDNRIVEILGEGYYFLGDNVNSLKYLQEYVALAPNGDRIDDVYYLMGEIFMRRAEYHRADIALSTAVYYSPNISQWWARLGYARELAKNPRMALDAYDKALTLSPNQVDALRGKERVQASLGGQE